MSDNTIQAALETAARHHRAGELPAAEAIYRQVLALMPNDPDALHLLGVLAAQVGNAEAIPLLRKAIAQRPEFPEAYAHLGNALHMRGEIGEAITCYRSALAQLPEFPEAWSNLGNALTTAGEPDEAVRCCRRALALQPNLPEAHNNLGAALRALGKSEESIAQFRAAIRSDPNLAEAHGNLAHALLQRGEWQEGSREYEWRWRCDTFRAPRTFAQPQWDGSNLAGRTILVHAEQGLGDTIQFVRFIPKVIEKGGRVMLECAAPLLRLLREAKTLGDCSVVSDAAQTRESFDVHLPMLSLPFALGVRSVADIPRNVPYLAAVPRALQGNGLQVGLAWSGSATHTDDRNRSIPLQLLLPLLSLQDVTFYSLQVGEAAREARIAEAGTNLIDMSDQISDFTDTAEIIASLDLVICVDTAVAHLAGAMGKRVWVLLPFVADFRWMLDREDSPWYPTMRLFRQTRSGDWGDIISRLRNAPDSG